MIAEDGISDYGFAKRKAARQLGAVNADELPNNAEIDAEVRTYPSPFSRTKEHLERQQFLRIAAAGSHARTRSLPPYLTGAVLEGAAGATPKSKSTSSPKAPGSRDAGLHSTPTPGGR